MSPNQLCSVPRHTYTGWNTQTVKQVLKTASLDILTCRLRTELKQEKSWLWWGAAAGSEPEKYSKTWTWSLTQQHLITKFYRFYNPVTCKSSSDDLWYTSSAGTWKHTGGKKKLQSGFHQKKRGDQLTCELQKTSLFLHFLFDSPGMRRHRGCVSLTSTVMAKTLSVHLDLGPSLKSY